MKRSAANSVSVAFGVIIFVLAFWCAPPAALAQCAMCKAAAAAAGNNAAETLNTAILVLLIPPVMIFCAIFFVAYRLRAGAQEGDESRETPADSNRDGQDRQDKNRKHERLKLIAES